jgi:hypothetical protein
MVLRGEIAGTPFAARLRDEALTVSLGAGLVAACDRAGRLYSLWRDGHTYRRGLNGRMLDKWQDEAGRHRRWLEGDEADAVVEAAAAVFARIREHLAATPGSWSPPAASASRHEMLAALEAGAAFTSAAARADAARFEAVYAPIGILPPDQYLALVVQATIGCSFDTCTFCDLYHERYRVRSRDEFARHVASVRAYLGRSLSLRRRSIFLGSANALAVPQPRLLELVDVLPAALETEAPMPIGAFVDGFTGLRKTADDYRALAGRGLRRVYIGLESGHDPLLAFVRKPATREAAVETVRAIKSAGLSVGVIVMIGLGGDRYAAGHVADTIAALDAMLLDRGDIIYFSDLVEVPWTPYPALASDAGIRPLDAAERRRQRETIRASLRFAGPPPRMTTYSVLDFVY